MQRLSSDITLIRWSYSVLLVFATGVFAFAGGHALGSIIWFSLMTLTFTAGMIFEEKKALKGVLTALCGIGTLTAFFLFPELWWAGLLISAVMELWDPKSPVMKALTVMAGSGAVFAVSVSRDVISGIDAVKSAVFLFCAVMLYITAAVFFAGYKARYVEFEAALRRSALDSMSERKLREELSYRMAEEELNARLLERERISRDIHNSVGHTLSAASVTLDAAKILVETDKDKAQEKMDVANDRIKSGIDAIRGVVRTLDSSNDTVLVKDYALSLSKLTDNFAMDTDVKVYHNLDEQTDEGGIDISAASFISGAVSELLTNGLKHGGAKVFVIMLTTDPKHIMLKVQDNGRGFGDISAEEEQRLLRDGFGLRKLKDSTRSLGGEMRIDGSDGFKVTINIPRVEGKREK